METCTECPVCLLDPSSHSFRKVSEQEFYTCPAEASKYWDTEGILQHYTILLDNHGLTPWVWIFDCSGLEIKHMTELSTAYGIATLLNEKYGTHLKKIMVKNPTWHIHAIISILWPFLNDHIRGLIDIIPN